MRKDKYVVAWGANSKSLANDVNEKLNEGYMLYGSALSNNNCLYQPMVLETLEDYIKN